ncbi:beta-lactamase class A [Sphingobium fontiphilum]|uniref:Beta-lactamase n=1 Tax=Sphingobium fontiphilum TaxID=944425 RepID=A0A7W6DIX2_9SPHN|nr:SGM family class A beta-lactamase [Sphingobium fontiphilum]MBB3980683.1 beta-lactamase class A [Sphingobium fontiphilum]
MALKPALLIATMLMAIGARAAPEKPRPSLLPPPPRYTISESVVRSIRNPREIEISTGGRLGVALVDSKGALLLGFNRDDRFAMCSTFKAPLAAAILMGADAGKFGLEGEISFSGDDILDYAPVVKKNKKRGRMSMAELAQAAVEVSDNSAANLLLPMIGGPPGLTAFVKAHGDAVTRLDRDEPTLNENAQGDPRDTTSPAAMAALMARLMFRDMEPQSAGRLRGWMMASPTGDKRIRAGLPKEWKSGSKTGTCGNAYNDVALLMAPSGDEYILSVYLDRPTVDAKASEAAIAEVAAAVVDFLGRMQKTGLD